MGSGVDNPRLYLRDLGDLVKELARSAKRESDEAGSGEDRAFARGRLMALYEVVSLMQQQAHAFEITYADICLDDVNPERDLL